MSNSYSYKELKINSFGIWERTNVHSNKSEYAFFKESLIWFASKNLLLKFLTL